MDEDPQAQARARTTRQAAGLALYGVPFAVKDNIAVAGLPSTAACPAYACQPATDAAVVARLRAAGAIVIGKTNPDQFTTGLNGTRSLYGAPRSVFDADYVSGGSAVASGLAVFVLSTDSAGSGRVPAAFNNLVGIKPTPGLVPNTGVVPACRGVDVVSIFAGSVADAVAIRRVIEGLTLATPSHKGATGRSARQPAHRCSDRGRARIFRQCRGRGVVGCGHGPGRVAGCRDPAV